VAVGVVGMSAYEAHIINVTAQIENALSVTPDDIMFGTVFPQESIDKSVRVALSGSFIDEERVDDINYVIRQKPKCIRTEQASQDLPMYGRVTEEGDVFVCVDDDDYDILPVLCPFLSKHEITEEEVENDSEGINAFHGPISGWDLQDTLGTQVAGRLAKSEQDTEDVWNIDFRVPCFEGMCAQDWAAFVELNNPGAVAADYILPAELEHEMFGCDLWIEVTEVSRSNIIGIYKENDDYPDGDPDNVLGDRIGTLSYEVAGGNLTGTVVIDTPAGQAWIDSGHDFTMVLNGPRTGALVADSTNGRLASAACATGPLWDGGWWSNRTLDNTGMTDGDCDGFDDADGVTPLTWMEGYYNFESGVSGATLKGVGGATFSVLLPGGSYDEVQFLLKDQDGGWASVGEYPGAGEVDGLTSFFDFSI